MLKIGLFSKLSKISIRMLRHYDEMGLLIPDNTDNLTGYRYYSEAQLPIANRITALKNMGFSLAVITEILKAYHDTARLEEYLRLKCAELEDEMTQTSERLHLIKTTLMRFGKDETKMKYDVTLKEIPQRNVASVRKVIPTYNDEHVLWELLCRETAPLNVQTADPSYSLAIFHDGEHRDNDVDVELQISVKGNYKNTEHVSFKTVPAVQVASATYKGSYELITEANEAVANWVMDNNYEFAGVSFCIYHVSPSETQNPDELVTEVCYPVKKKAE